MVTKSSLNLTPKQKLSKLLKPDEIPIILGFYIMIVNNFKTIAKLNGSLNSKYPIVIAKIQLQPKNQKWGALPFRLTYISRPKYACFILSIKIGSSIHTCLT